MPTSQIPSLAINDTFTVASQAAMLALTAQRGDVAVRTDFDPDRSYVLAGDDPTVLANWVRVTFGDVASVNGQTGAVVLAASDVGAQPISEKDQASGYAALNVSRLVDAARLGSGARDGTRFLRDDNTWQSVSASATEKLTVADNYADYVVDGLLAVASLPVSLSPGLTIPAGRAYIAGLRADQPSAAARAYTASRDTYVDLSSAGVYTYVEVANNAAEPALTANSIRLFKVVTSATQITSIVDMRPPNPFSAYKQGLQLVWVAANTLRVMPGSAFVPGENKVIHFPVQTDISVSFTASTTNFYYVYLYRDSSTGRGAIEYNTTPPAAPYRGGAKTKTGDTTRRYLGSVRPNGAATPAMYCFIRTPDGIVQYRENLYHGVAPFSLINGAAPAAGTVVPLGQTGTTPLNLVPAQCRMAFINIFAQATLTTTIQTSDDSLTEAVKNPQHGKGIYELPDAPRPINALEDAEPDEEVFTEYQATQQSWVWDASQATLRPPTAEEQNRRALERETKSKIFSFLLAAWDEYLALYPETEGDYGAVTVQRLARTETARWIESTEAPDPAREQAKDDVLTKFRRARAHIAGMAQSGATPEEIRNEPWSGQ